MSGDALVVVFVAFEGSGSEDASSSQESATLAAGLLYLWWGAILFAAGLGSGSEFLSVAASDVVADVVLISSATSNLAGVAAVEVPDFSVAAGVDVGVLTASLTGAVVLVSTVLLAWAYLRCGGV